MFREIVNRVAMQKIKQSKPLVSVIIPTFNYAHFLPIALESTLSQKEVPFEIIVVDDGSTDETCSVLNEYRSRVQSGLHILHQGNTGLSAARNAGIMKARGEFLVFLDADDILPENTLASQLDVLRSFPDLQMVVCRNFFFENTDSDGKLVRTGQWRLFNRDLDIHLCHFNIAPPHAFMTRRCVIDRIGGFDTRLKACEDHDFWFRAIAQKLNIAVNPKTEVAYRRHPDSMSCDTGNQWRHDAIMHERIGDHLEANPWFPEGGRLEGLMAHIAGCLTTAVRLEETNPKLHERMVTLAMSARNMLRCELPSTKRCPDTLLYFLRRIYCLLSRLLQNNKPWVQKMDQCLRQIFGEKCPRTGLQIDDYQRLAEVVANRMTKPCLLP